MLNDIGFVAAAIHAGDATGRPLHVDPARRGDSFAAKPVRPFSLPMPVGKIIVQTISQYARQTHNWSLLHLIDRIQNPDAAPARQQPPPPRPPKPDLPPDERDYRSIVDVLEKNGRNVSMAVLGKVRRRWLERPPRDPSSPYPNRLADVLARMVTDGVLAKQELGTCQGRTTPDTWGRRSQPQWRDASSPCPPHRLQVNLVGWLGPPKALQIAPVLVNINRVMIVVPTGDIRTSGRECSFRHEWNGRGNGLLRTCATVSRASLLLVLPSPKHQVPRRDNKPLLKQKSWTH